MDAHVRDKLNAVIAELFPEGKRERSSLPWLRLMNETERRYSRSLRMVQGITGTLDEAAAIEHYYAPIPGDEGGWCAVCGKSSTHLKHRGSSSAAKEFIIGAFQLYTELTRYAEKVKVDARVMALAAPRELELGNATETELTLDCAA